MIATMGPEVTTPKQRIFEELRVLLSPEASVKLNEPLAKKTTLRVGGPADAFVEPASERDLSEVLKFCRRHSLEFVLLGRGSNFLIKDGGFRGIVIQLSKPFFNSITVAETSLICGAGAKLKAVANEARDHNLAGLEFLEGIPGSVGGALRMNAGAMGGEIFDVVESVRLMDELGNVSELQKGEMEFSYRSCALFEKHIAISATLTGKPDSREAIEQRMQASNQKRWDSQPAAASAGCMFKNPDSVPAGKLIDELGLKRTRVGGMQVSEVHGNFIVNTGNGTAADALELIERVKSRVLRERGIELKTEVQIIGE